MAALTPWDVLEAYEAMRPVLPSARFGHTTTCLPDLSSLTGRYDLFLFDAFGVLNVGETVIPTAPDRLNALRAAGKAVLMVSNGASFPAPMLLEKYRQMGLGMTASTLVSSREVMARWPHAQPGVQQTLSSAATASCDATPTAVSPEVLRDGFTLGVMALEGVGLDDMPWPCRRLEDEAATYSEVDGFVLLGAGEWTPRRQALLVQALTVRPRPVWVANPDLVAPREHGFSVEPGSYAHALQRDLNCPVHYLGKPHRPIFELTLERAGYSGPADRVLMVGDTLHTDILGGKAMGFDTALVVGPGASHGLDLDAAIALTGIRPDYVVPAI